jgi:hypothetical protein
LGTERKGEMGEGNVVLGNVDNVDNLVHNLFLA